MAPTLSDSRSEQIAEVNTYFACQVEFAYLQNQVITEEMVKSIIVLFIYMMPIMSNN